MKGCTCADTGTMIITDQYCPHHGKKAKVDKLKTHKQRADKLEKCLREVMDFMRYSSNNLEYSAFNLNGDKKKVSDLKPGICETTCPEGTLLIEIRNLKLKADHIQKTLEEASGL